MLPLFPEPITHQDGASKNDCESNAGKRLLPALREAFPQLPMIELIFKACKNSLNANQITSSDENIIESLLLASIAAHLSSCTLFNIGIEQLEEKKQWAISFQRVAKVAVVLARDFILFLLNSSRDHFDNLLHKIKLFANEMYDPNYKKRETSLMRINRLLSEGEV